MSARPLPVAVAVLALALGGCGSGAEAPERPVAARPGGSTLRGTLRDTRGDGVLRRAPGEPLLPRTELRPATRPGRVIARLAIIADAHVRDEETPARVPFLDRLGTPYSSVFRPQETLTAQVLAAAAASVRDFRPGAVIEAGDIADSAQENEFTWGIAALRGGRVHPDSGAPGYEGPQEAGGGDPLYYRPAVDPPRHPGLLAWAQRAFRSPGVGAPWLPVLGNHDALVDGELVATPRTEAIATGDRALWEPPRGVRAVRRALRRLLDEPLPPGTVRVAPDPRRRELTHAQAVARLRAAAVIGGSGPWLDYARDVAPGVRLIALDLVSASGGSTGRVHPGQVVWLRGELRRAGRRVVLVTAHQALRSTAGGGAILAALDADPHVAAVLTGHTHRALITPRRTHLGGYWLISTPSLADFPQEARALVLRAAPGGGVTIDTWLLDTAPSPLADIARQLAFLDVQGGRPLDLMGRRGDRNARLF